MIDVYCSTKRPNGTNVGYALLAVGSFVTLNAPSTEAGGGAETIVTVVKILILFDFDIARDATIIWIKMLLQIPCQTLVYFRRLTAG